MKKIISSLLVLTIIALFSLTWYCSHQTQLIFTEQVSTSNQALAEFGKIELIDYQRNLFTSTAKTAVSLSGGEEIRFNHQVRHFVWGVKMVTTLAPNTTLTDKMTSIVPLEELQIITDFSLTGASESQLIIPEITFEEEGSHIGIAGLSVGWNLNNDMTTGGVVFHLDHFQFKQDGQGGLSLSNLKLMSQITDVKEVPLGNGELQLGSLQITKQNKPVILCEDIHYKGKTELNQGSYNSLAELNIENLLLGKESFNKGQLKFSISGMESKKLRSLMQTAQQLQQQSLEIQGNSNELQLQLLSFYTQLFDSGVTLTLDKLSLQTEGGKFNGTGKLTLLNHPARENMPFFLGNLAGALRLIIDRGAFVTGYRFLNNLNIVEDDYQNPAILAEQAEQLAGGLIQKGIFVPKGKDHYLLDFTWSEGSGKINGVPLN